MSVWKSVIRHLLFIRMELLSEPHSQHTTTLPLKRSKYANVFMLFEYGHEIFVYADYAWHHVNATLSYVNRVRVVYQFVSDDACKQSWSPKESKNLFFWFLMWSSFTQNYIAVYNVVLLHHIDQFDDSVHKKECIFVISDIHMYIYNHCMYHWQKNSTGKSTRVMKKLISQYYNTFPENYGLIVVLVLMVKHITHVW